MAAERRKNFRYDINENYYYYPDARQKKIICTLNNISVTGACISSDETIKNNEIIYLHIKGADDISLRSKIVWKLDNQYGLLFLLDTEKEFENISYIMNYIVKIK